MKQPTAIVANTRSGQAPIKDALHLDKYHFRYTAFAKQCGVDIAHKYNTTVDRDIIPIDINNEDSNIGNVNAKIGAGIKSIFAVMVRGDTSDKCWFRNNPCWCVNCRALQFDQCLHTGEVGGWVEKPMKQVPVVKKDDTEQLVANALKADLQSRISAQFGRKKFPNPTIPVIVAIVNNAEVQQGDVPAEFVIGVLYSRPQKSVDTHETECVDIHSGISFDISEDEWIVKVLLLEPLSGEAHRYVVPSDNAVAQWVPLRMIIAPGDWSTDDNHFPICSVSSQVLPSTVPNVEDVVQRIVYDINVADFAKLLEVEVSESAHNE
jgi:hypothetical protein